MERIYREREEKSGRYTLEEVNAAIQRSETQLARCMASGYILPAPRVRASHIRMSYTNGAGLEEFGLEESDVHNIRNVLLMADKIEKAFDALRVGFEYNLLQDSFILRVLDPSLYDLPICDFDAYDAERVMGNRAFLRSWPCREPPSDHNTSCGDSAGDQTWEQAFLKANVPTFRMVNGFQLQCSTSAESKMPFRRLLSWHFVKAVENAVDEGWISAPTPDTTPRTVDAEVLFANVRRHSPTAKLPGELLRTYVQRMADNSLATGSQGALVAMERYDQAVSKSARESDLQGDVQSETSETD